MNVCLPAPRLVFLAAAAVASAATGWSASAPVRTPSLTEGPFYPFNSSNTLPPLAQRDADLTRVDGAKSPAAGKTLLLSGVVRDLAGQPVAGASVEIWQTDDGGVYYHSGDRSDARDAGFQHFGACTTDAQGRYAFRTVMPGLYTGRARHIHFKAKRGDVDMLTSQFVFEDQRAEFARDGVTRRLSGEQLETLVLAPAAGSDANGAGVLLATKDIVLDPSPTARSGGDRTSGNRGSGRPPPQKAARGK